MRLWMLLRKRDVLGVRIIAPKQLRFLGGYLLVETDSSYPLSPSVSYESNRSDEPFESRLSR